ncbi:MAG: NfeD family protein [Lachnospiraceae bacterium]
MEIFYWLFLFIFLIVVEIVTMQLVCIWFAFGSFAAILAAIFHVEVEFQLIVFLAISFILLLTVRPLAQSLMNGHYIKTNAASLVGMKARVTKKIHNAEGYGMAVVKGQEWTAIALNDEDVFEVGEFVVIDKISGVKLIVKKNE